jgi:hypothetical protein
MKRLWKQAVEAVSTMSMAGKSLARVLELVGLITSAGSAPILNGGNGAVGHSAHNIHF